ncbi:uncharacterized protein LOC133859059 [Alnus glutinosa]|uniref:uncharacterized protein LOC133859059 n=1 Tax=Alnus glutinosa TaxID=3517 RepID=UPI002D788747|nr:uncharacterized protein LOC133859059 [Alnus glutinosa]
MGKPNTILDFFKRKNAQSSNVNVSDTSSPTSDIIVSENSSKKSRRIDVNEFDISSLEFDPRLRRQIWEYNVNQRDEIRRAYIQAGPYQFILKEYPKSGNPNHLRSFQPSWFNLFLTWLEYSKKKDAAFCLPCFLFNKPSGHPTQRVFTIDGFRNWKKVRDGKNCAFLNHIGKDPNSFHRIAKRSCEDLKNWSQHIQNGIAFRGRDESVDSTNRGNFLEILNLIVLYNEQIAEETIRKEIGNAKFRIIVDEARDESMKEQMAIVLRFVDKDGFVRERFFGLVHVSNTAAVTLQNGIYFVLSQHKLAIENIRGQGYDGASNMRGGWNGLQALVSNDCPYAYYIHCFAHCFQLALVAASKEVIHVHQFFTNLTSIVNIVCASCSRFEELRIAQTAEIAYLIEIDEIQSGRGLNQISNLQRAGDTRWSSHLRSVSSLIKIFSPACEVLLKIIDVGTTSSQ